MDTESSALISLRRRGQYLISSVMWACVLGLLLLISAYLLIIYHYALSVADRFQLDPRIILAAGPLILFLVLAVAWIWYRRVWNRRLRETWPDSKVRKRFSHWRADRTEYLSALRQVSIQPEHYDQHAEALLIELERDIAERALATGLIVGVSHSRFIDLFTIFAATLELQLHVLTTLGKRPSWHTWRLLIQRCGASLFINSYLNRQDALMLNVMIKKAGMGLSAAGDMLRDIDLDDALGMQHGGVLGVATKSLEIGATMALTVGQVGLHTLGALIESVGDELAQGAVASGIIYYHGMSLAADSLGIKVNRSARDAIWKMGEVAGAILLDFIRQRRLAFRERRQQVVKRLPKAAYEKVQSLFGKKIAVE